MTTIHPAISAGVAATEEEARMLDDAAIRLQRAGVKASVDDLVTAIGRSERRPLAALGFRMGRNRSKADLTRIAQAIASITDDEQAEIDARIDALATHYGGLGYTRCWATAAAIVWWSFRCRVLGTRAVGPVFGR